VASGLAAEARIAKGPGVRCIVGAGASLRAALEREAAGGARALLSFGLAGGLAPELRAGDWLIGRAVVTDARRWAADLPWTKALAAHLPAARIADVAGSDHIIADPGAKRKNHVALGAAAVDMESHLVAEVAERHALPFAVLRVVADAADCPLPPAACIELAPGGRLRWLSLLESVVTEPAQIPSLMRLARDARRALQSLSRGRRGLSVSPGADFCQLVLDVH
jgi:hopanoid-associated phosphorylase